MKKKLFSLALALALCLGLAVPAFAANASSSAQISVQTRNKSGIILEKKTDTFQLMYPTGVQEGHNVSYKAPEAAFEETVHLTPVAGGDIQVVCSGLGPEQGVYVFAWTDPDGDGIYGMRLLNSENRAWTDTKVLPVPKGNTFAFTGSYKTFATPEDLGLTPSNGSVSISAGKLYEMFGPNTYVEIAVYDTKTMEATDCYEHFLLTGEKTKTVANIFTDVPAGNWVSDPVAWAVQNEITNGYGAKDKFAPGADCTEAQILTFLYRAEGKPPGAIVVNAMTQAAAEAYKPAVSWASLHHMIDKDFKQDTPCTRAQAVKFIWQAFGEPKAEKAGSFTDVDKNADYAEAVSWAVEQGITNGYGGSDTFAPDKVCNRGEIAAFLYRAYNN